MLKNPKENKSNPELRQKELENLILKTIRKEKSSRINTAKTVIENAAIPKPQPALLLLTIEKMITEGKILDYHGILSTKPIQESIFK